MPHELNASVSDFERQFANLLHARRDNGDDVDEVVAAIIDDVRGRGDAALLTYTKRFDRLDVGAKDLRVPQEEIERAAANCDSKVIDALGLAARRIETFHRRQIPADIDVTDEIGVRQGWRWTALSAVGLYVPGGTAAYPSSVLMNAIPAKVAGVGRMCMVVPTPDGHLNPLVLAAARLAGVHEIFRVGGAQAVAALAYGTESIAPVDKIVGPGNAYVAAAKRRVFGDVGIDMIAGPSEILVVADANNDPACIAADLLSQAEHDESAQSILITNDADFAEAVKRAIGAHLQVLPRSEIAGASWRDHGAIIVVPDLADSIALIDRIAPEHLELAIEDPASLAAKVRNAGAIFLGRFTPEAVGDYLGGPNHVLPTARSARFSSGLSVLDFMKRTSLLGCDIGSLRQLGPAAAALAEAEGLSAHALSVTLRLEAPTERTKSS
jgi:histidinol dehydrogenase